ncbi:MAG TPA: hypothetical protein VGU24_06870 [Microvirga sp.]|jgi:hypothetical protein|nr:hypothetical protein [Microvirga sp.]
MKKLAVLSAAALIGLGTVASTTSAEAQSRRGAAVAAGVIGGLAAGALIAGAANAYAAPRYGYGYGYGYAPAPAYGHGYAPAYGYGYAPVVQQVYVPPRRVYRTTRVVQTYPYAPTYYSRPAVSIGLGFGSPYYRW